MKKKKCCEYGPCSSKATEFCNVFVYWAAAAATAATIAAAQWS
jgi:hypothetical protein